MSKGNSTPAPAGNPSGANTEAALQALATGSSPVLVMAKYGLTAEGFAQSLQAQLESQQARIRTLEEALQPIANAYPDDPGTSDLDGEQPVVITLRDVRRVWVALR